MKLVALYLLAFGLNVSATGFSQTVTLNEKSISYQQLFRLIHKQTGYQVFYKSNLLDGNERLQLNVNQLPVEKVLTLALKNKPLTYSIIDKSIVIKEAPDVATTTRLALVPEAFAMVKGVVKNTEGHPLPGVSITIAGTSKGTTTDENGSFTIDVKPGESLQFSRVGYVSVTIKPGTQTVLNVKMELAHAIGEEVIVVGYGTQRRKDVSGAVATISKELLESRPINNMMQGLQGLSPDLLITRSSGQPGNEGWSMQLRGISSINGTNNPLVIVDGTEYPDINQLNPLDVETVTILKDAATASIYGAKAANGVILITTKTGKSGKIQLTYNGMYQVKRPLNVPEIIPYWQGWSIQQLAIANAKNLPAPELDPVYLNLLKTAPGYVLNDSTYKSRNYFNTDYVDLLIQKYYANMSHNIGVSGGNENNRYFIGLGAISNDGILKVGPDSYKRQNIRFNLSNKFNKFLSLDSRIAYTRATTLSAGGTSEVSGDYSLLYNIYNLRNNTPITVPGYDDRYYGNSTYGLLKEGGYNKKADQALDGTFTLTAKNIVKGLVLSSMFSPRIQQTNQDEFDKPVYFWSPSPASDPNAPVYQAVPVNWVQNTTPVGGSRSQIFKRRTTQTSYTYNVLADYTKAIGNHHFHGLAGFQYQYYNYDYTGVIQSNLSNTDLPTLNYSSNATTQNNFLRDRLARNTLVSYFGRFNYDYDNRYYIELNARNDASSRLAPGYQSITYPSVSAAWRISQEGFFRNNVPLFNELKIKASWGKLGNAQLSEYPWERNYLAFPNLSSTTYPFNGVATNGLYLNTLASGALGWESVTTRNIGVDFALLNNRLSGSFDYYTKTNANMLVTVKLPGIIGIEGATSNDGKLVTQGWGVSLNWNDQVGSNFRYRVGVNFSDNTNKLVASSQVNTYEEGQVKLLLGYPVRSVWGYQAIGYFKDTDDVNSSPKQFNTTIQGPGDLKYADINGDKIISAGSGTAEDHGDLVNFGTTDPRYLFGVNLGAGWKNIDFSAFFQGVGKRTFVIYPYKLVPFLNSWRYPWSDYVDNYWTPERQTDIRYPRPVQNSATTNSKINSSYLQNGAYVRLKNIQIGYTFNSGIIKKAKANSVRVYFSGQDIWTYSKAWYKFFDPESPSNVNFPYQYTATYAFGLDIKF